MDYQLVLQFEGDSFEILDSIVELEDNLIEALDDIAEVDGHEVGSGEANIYIFTSDPSVAFQSKRPNGLINSGNRWGQAWHIAIDGNSTKRGAIIPCPKPIL